MKPRTRQLLDLLGDPLTDAVLGRCAAGPQTVAQLRHSTGGSATVLKERLRLLSAYGLVTEGPLIQGDGRPAASWVATGVDELRRFEAQADRFARDLLKVTERLLDQEADSRRSGRLRVLPDR